MYSSEQKRTASRIIYTGLFVNVFLALIKISSGIFGLSTAVIADGIHTISDSVSDVVAIVGLKVSQKPVDESHHYGHGKFETLSAAIIGLMVFLAGIGIIITATEKLTAVIKGFAFPVPRLIVLLSVFLSIISKELMFRYSYNCGKKINSSVLVANAWHHRSDAVSSLAVFAGISALILLGDRFYFIDPCIAAVVAFIVIRASYKIINKSLSELLETSLNKDIEAGLINKITAVEGVIKFHNFKTRSIGNNSSVELHILVNNDLNIMQAHDIATQVEKAIRNELGENTFVSVHTEPFILNSEDPKDNR